MPEKESPFACNMGAMPSGERERYNAIVRRLFAAVEERSETADGYAFRIDSNRIGIAETAEWIALERKCCPFFDFKLEVGREGGPVSLEISGRNGVKQFIRAEFRF